MPKLKWGILSTAKIAVDKVIPALQKSQYCQVTAIGSRESEKAKNVARDLDIPTAYGSYEELLADKDIDVIYNPLPNHMHVPWSVKALRAGKHVLCEKPLAPSVEEAEDLKKQADLHPHLKVMEAFMYRFHPQWRTAKQMVKERAIGHMVTINTLFSYYNVDAENIRNKANMGGGGLMDIGCYAISLSRFLYDAEPQRILGYFENDPAFQVDRLSMVILDFEEGMSTFTVSTQMSPYQRVQIFGTRGRIEIEIPFNAPPDRPTRLWIQHNHSAEEKEFDICDQYTLQGDEFAASIINDAPVPTPLDDAIANLKVIEALRESHRTKTWQSVS